MADLSILTGQKVMPVHPTLAEIYSVVLAEAMTQGQASYLVATTGKYGIADANAAGKQQFRGIVLESGGAGQGVGLLKRGAVWGYDLSGLNYDAPVYLSDTAGALADAAGTMSVIVGRVMPLTDAGTLTKVLYIYADWLRAWS